MAERFVHHVPYRSRQQFMDAWDVSSEEMHEYTFWNIWQRKAPGWDLQEGSIVTLLGSWPGRTGRPRVKRFMLDVRACDVQHWEVPTWKAAVDRIVTWTGYSPSDVRLNPYTASKKAKKGPLFVMAWRPDPVRWTDISAPKSLVVGRNGWNVLERDAYPSSSPTKSSKPAAGEGQGRRLDVAARNAVENRAMSVAKAWCKNHKWTNIRDTSSSRPWDLEATDTKGTRRYIEVKGTTGAPTRFDVTAGEVNAARTHGPQHLLIAVHHVELVQRADGSVLARGGDLEVFDPWDPQKTELSETRYTWTPE